MSVSESKEDEELVGRNGGEVDDFNKDEAAGVEEGDGFGVVDDFDRDGEFDNDDFRADVDCSEVMFFRVENVDAETDGDKDDDCFFILRSRYCTYFWIKPAPPSASQSLSLNLMPRC